MPQFNFLQILGLFLGTAETIVPIFIHNPQSQRIEGVVMTSTNNLFSTILQLQQAHTAAKQTPSPGTDIAAGAMDMSKMANTR